MASLIGLQIAGRRSHPFAAQSFFFFVSLYINQIYTLEELDNALETVFRSNGFP